MGNKFKLQTNHKAIHTKGERESSVESEHMAVHWTAVSLKPPIRKWFRTEFPWCTWVRRLRCAAGDVCMAQCRPCAARPRTPLYSRVNYAALLQLHNNTSVIVQSCVEDYPHHLWGQREGGVKEWWGGREWKGGGVRGCVCVREREVGHRHLKNTTSKQEQ